LRLLGFFFAAVVFLVGEFFAQQVVEGFLGFIVESLVARRVEQIVEFGLLLIADLAILFGRLERLI
jgi:hypothetical protein